VADSLEGPRDSYARGPRRDRRKARAALTKGKRYWRLGFRGAIPLLLVCLTLLGSVAIPARQTWLITRILRETVEGLAPARLLVEQLQSGLGKEVVTLQSYAISGDDSLIGEYRATVAIDDRRVESLRTLAERSEGLSPGRVSELALRVEKWHDFSSALLSRGDSAARRLIASDLGSGEAIFDSSLAEIATLSSELAALSNARDERVSSLEQMSIAVNAVLVLAAMVAMAGVLMLTLRERRLTAVLRRSLREARGRARREAALREASEALAGAYTTIDVTQRIARAALRAMQGRGAFVARISKYDGEPPEVVVRAVMGDDVLPVSARRAYESSYTKLAIEKGAPILVDDLQPLEEGGSFGGFPYPGGSAIVVPLNDGANPVGALFVLGSPDAPFKRGSVSRAEVFGHLATLAYEKVRLIEEAHEQRRALERVAQSRARLMRGFSHDVKNPIGAADGFAELLAMGLYGELNEQQKASVERMRRSIQTALALIEDLHELARAETGMVTLALERVDLAELVQSMSEEYHATAAASGLALSVTIECDDAVVETDPARVRQIAANLLSNAIKYTDQGSVQLRVANARADESGRWVLLEFTDSGMGIAPDKQEYIFEEFSRAGGSDRAGAGLGLAISRLLAQALGGRITVNSAEGRGSTFTLWLPADEVHWGLTPLPAGNGV
jgi:signal transduction histidine kinase/CHASE3 domain sensor protein